MTTSAAEKLAGSVVEKKEEKVEKRRALGRGLESLLPGPRVVGSPAHLPSPPFAKDAKDGPPADAPSPQGLKPESSPAMGGTAEAVPFPTSAGAGSSGHASGKQVSRFARDDKENREGPASEKLDASRTGVSDSHEPLTEEVFPGEVISIQAVAEDRIVGNRVVHLPIEVIEKNPYQTRYVFDEEMLQELRDSIKEHGVVQPVVVRPAEKEGRYILILGQRRCLASKMAGKDTIPSLVRRLSPQQAAEMTVLENVVREDLNPIEQAEAFRVLSLQFKLTQVQIADRIGVSRETVANYMRLLRLPEKVMSYMLEERLSFSDARELLRLESEEHIEAVAEEIVTHKLKWDQIEDRVMRINGSFPMLPGQTMPGEKKKKGGARWMDPNVRAAQTDMERTLGMRVRIRDRHGKGRIVIEYATVDDYERVTGMLRGKK
jgi:ParB family chromosome partitioning protein